MHVRLNTIVKQNCIQFQNQYYRQNDGLTMGHPTSGMLAEIVVQYLEHNTIFSILMKHHIIDYFHVNDISCLQHAQHKH